MNTALSTNLAPLDDHERLLHLDVVRGVALFGVMWINLLTGFRVSLFEHLLTFHTHPGWLNEWIDLVSVWLIEFKAFTVFSFLFGVGVGVQIERLTAGGIEVGPFMFRRFLFFLWIGLFHLILIWNGDILFLYAVCGMLLIASARLSQAALVGFGIVAIAVTFSSVSGMFIPSSEAMRAHADASTPVYANGTYLEILTLRVGEYWKFIVPLWFSAFPKTLGLMLLGMATWRTGILKQPGQHRGILICSFVILTTLGASTTSMIFWSAITGKALPVPPVLVEAFSYIPLALGLTAGLLLLLSDSCTGVVARLFAAAGQMALTHYLAQSVIFSLIFYGFGLGLFGKLAPAPTAVIGLLVFSTQLITGRVWLRHFRFGPAEWLWRSLTYGRVQSMRRTSLGSF